MGIIFFYTTFVIVILMFLSIYTLIKFNHNLQAYQQSAYNEKRYIRYIKSNYKYTFGINELLPLIIIIVLEIINIRLNNPIVLLIELFLAIVFIYYNLKFFNISKKRYIEKISLKYTWRVKRFIILYVILNLVVCTIVLSIFKIHLVVILSLLILLTYFIPCIILITSLLISPLERNIRLKFKKSAMNKIRKYNNLTTIGITGSYGKTSIKNIVNDLIKEEKITLQTPSSFNTPMGLSIVINNELSKMHEVFIAEMGAYYQGEIKELTDMVSPKIGIVSSIGPQHLETFKDINTIQKTKMELIEGLPEDGLGILNYDNKYIREYIVKNNVTLKYYSLENKNVDLYAYDIEYLYNGMKFKIILNNETYDIETKLLGKHSIYNILSGILVSLYMGIKIEKIIKNIKLINPISNRLELKYINSQLTIIDDAFNGNIEGMIEGVNILKRYKETKILITPGIIDGGSENDKLNEEYAKNINDIDYVLFVGKYNKVALNQSVSKTTNKFIENFDNFIDAYNFAQKINESKIILIANDLPDKFN